MTRGKDVSYGAVVLPLKALYWLGGEETAAHVELERSQCPSPSSSLDIDTNPLIWAVADRLVLSLLMEQDDDDLDEEEEEEEQDYLYYNLPKPIPVHPANVGLLVTPARPENHTTNNKSNLPRSQSAIW